MHTQFIGTCHLKVIESGQNITLKIHVIILSLLM